MNNIKFVFQFITLGLAIGFVIILIKPDLLQRAGQQPPTRPDTVTQPVSNTVVKPAATPDAGKEPDQGQPQPTAHTGVYSYANAVKLAAPAVVNIYTAKQVMQIPYGYYDPLHSYNRRYVNPVKPKYKAKSLGSGVIVSAKGYILTNNHVVKGADKIQVLLHDGRSTLAKLVGSDPGTDLAVLKIELKNLPVIQFGDSDKLQVGDVVLAIGNPYGVGQTVTQGIISAKKRDRVGLTTYGNFIQTDAAINPGNSGGALITATGQLIGINTAIFTKSGGSQGIGFAIPVSIAKRVLNSLIKHGRVVRGWLGVSVIPVNRRIASILRLKSVAGVMVVGLLQNSPAQKAGLLRRDVIIGVDNQKIKNSRHFINIIGNLKPGTSISLSVIRDGKVITTKTTVAQQPKIISPPRRQLYRQPEGIPRRRDYDPHRDDNRPPGYRRPYRDNYPDYP